MPGFFVITTEVMDFKDLNLNVPLLNALSDQGLTHPTPIQAKAFSPVMSGSDVCGIAQTGTGKTLAYLLPVFRRLPFSKTHDLRVLVVLPTRELVAQVAGEAARLAAHLPLTVTGVYGGVNMKPQIAALKQGTDVLIGTPGRLFDLALQGALQPKTIKVLVIDEVDELLHLGFRPQLNRLLERLPERRQNLLFSATLNPDVEQLLDVWFQDPVRIEAAPAGSPLENIIQTGVAIPNFNTKVNFLVHLLHEDTARNKVLVFARSKAMANILYDKLEAHFPDVVGVIHGDKEQNYRFNAMRAFAAGQYRVLIATDIVARGLDIEAVSDVVNFDLPETAETYIHRIGRTGRTGMKGRALALVTPEEIPLQNQIEALMKMEIPMVEIPQDVAISEELLPEELPQPVVKEIKLKLPKKEDVGPAFHPKSAKNSKVNQKISHAEKMKKKYGKKKTRGAKPKRRR